MLREGLFGGGAAISAGTQTVNNGTVIFSNQNGVTFGLSTGPGGAPATLTATVNPGPAAGMGGIIAGTQTQTSGSLSFVNSNSISFGLSNSSVITASVNFPAQTNQTQASGNIAGIGTTFVGANISGSLTLNSVGINMALSAPAESGVGISAAGSSQSAGQIVFSNLNGVSFGMNGSTITASVTPGGAGGIAASLSGNTSGALALISSGTLVFAGGNNITLSQNGNSVTISGANAGGAQTGISGMVVSNTTYTSGTVTFQNANGISFGSSGANGISASYTVPTQTNQTIGVYGISNTTGQSSSSTYDARSLSFQGAGVISVGNSGGTIIISSPGTSGITQLSAGVSTGGNTAGNTGLASAQLVLAGGANITLSGSTNAGSMTLSIIGAAGGGGGGVALQVSNTTYTSGTITFQNANGISFGSSGAGGISASYTVPTQTNQTIGIYGVSNTTGQSSSSTYDARSISFQGAGIISVGNSGGTVIISGPGTTGLTQLSAGMSTGGNTAGTTGLASAQLVLAGGANVTLSGSTNGGSMTISFAAPSPTAGSLNVSAGTTSGNLASVIFSNSNGVSFGLNGGTITASAAGGGGGGVNFGVSTGGNTAGNTGTVSTGNVILVGLGPISLSQVTGGAGSAATISINAPATSSIVGTNGISISTNGSTISVSQISPTIFFNSNTTGQSSSSTYAPQSLFMAGAGGASLGWSAGTVIVSGATGGGGGGGIAAQVSNTTYTSGTILFQNANGISFGSSGANGISASYTTPAVSSISGTGQVSVSVNGSTISIGVPALQTLTDGFNPYENQAVALGQLGQGSLLFDPEIMPNMQFDRIVIPIYNTNSTLSSGSHSISLYFGLYSRNASTLSLIGSTSVSTAVTQSGTVGSYSQFSGLRKFTMGSTSTLTSGKYWLAFVSRTSSAGADGSYSNLILAGANTALLPVGAVLSFGGQFGSSVNATNQLTLGQGFYSATTTGIPSSVAFSQINGTASNVNMQQILMFASSTV